MGGRLGWNAGTYPQPSKTTLTLKSVVRCHTMKKQMWKHRCRNMSGSTLRTVGKITTDAECLKCSWSGHLSFLQKALAGLRSDLQLVSVAVLLYSASVQELLFAFSECSVTVSSRKSTGA